MTDESSSSPRSNHGDVSKAMARASDKAADIVETDREAQRQGEEAIAKALEIAKPARFYTKSVLAFQMAQEATISAAVEQIDARLEALDAEEAAAFKALDDEMDMRRANLAAAIKKRRDAITGERDNAMLAWSALSRGRQVIEEADPK